MKIIRCPATPIAAPQWQCWRFVRGPGGHCYYELLAADTTLWGLMVRLGWLRKRRQETVVWH